LVTLKDRTVTISATSGLKRMDALNTSVVVEDAGEGGRHDDERMIEVKYW